MLIMKLRIDRRIYDDLQVTIFMGEENQTLQNIGSLNLTIKEYQFMGTALSLGGNIMKARFKVIFENEDKFNI